MSGKAVVPIIIGIILIIVDFIIRIPGGALTTRESYDGQTTSYYTFDDTYSSIDEYVGGDAYNYIIGACLVGAKMAGAMAARAIFIVGGCICFCIGVAHTGGKEYLGVSHDYIGK